ncbi:MAG: EamA family transporter [Clostridia bacterium]|nr:EamA family transporter [Clostridia bacterium]
MSIFNNWLLYVVLYLVLATIFTQFFKVATKTLKKAGALTVLLQMMAGLSALLLCPLFEFKFPTDIRVYLMLAVSIIFYAITDRVNTTVRSGIEASTFSMLKQLSTTFMIFAGLIFFKEEFVLTKFIGAMLIIISNVIIFYKKGKLEWNKYVLLGILANISFTIALFLDVNISDNFNLPFYVALTLLVPSILIMLFERIKPSEIKEEFINGNKKAILITALSWACSIIVQLRAYQLGNVTVIAPLCALTVMLNVIVGYLFLNERDNLIRKIISAILIIISIVLIKI